MMTAEKAIQKLNYTYLNGKMIRITYSSRDSSASRSGIGNLFIKVLIWQLLLHQIRKMDIKARSLPPNLKSSLLIKLREFKSDVNNFKTEVKRITSGQLNAAARDELLEAGMADTKTASADQRSRLMMSTERLGRTTDRVKDSRRTMMETEEIGVSMKEEEQVLKEQEHQVLKKTLFICEPFSYVGLCWVVELVWLGELVVFVLDVAIYMNFFD